VYIEGESESKDVGVFDGGGGGRCRQGHEHEVKSGKRRSRR
jgi:hypothetical protein